MRGHDLAARTEGVPERDVVGAWMCTMESEPNNAGQGGPASNDPQPEYKSPILIASIFGLLFGLCLLYGFFG